MNSPFLLIFWCICAPIAYLVVRREHRSGVLGKWRQIDRIFWVPICLVYGPFILVIMALISLLSKLASTNWAKREVRW